MTTEPGRIEVFGYDLASDLIGQVSFTELLLIGLRGERPTDSERRIVDAVLVAALDHGLTPSSLASRLVLDGAPESLQGAVAAGLLAVGSRFLGVVDDAARLLATVVGRGGDVAAAAEKTVDECLAAGRRVPGFGHNLLDGPDPRVSALIDVAAGEGAAREHVAALEAVAAAVRDRLGPTVLPNATAAIAAVLSDIGYSPGQCRGIVLVARCAGLLAQLEDEQARPMARKIWEEARLAAQQDDASDHERDAGSLHHRQSLGQDESR